MGGGGGGSSSSSNTTNKDDRIAADQSIVADEGSEINIAIEDVSPEALSSLVTFGERLSLVQEETLDFAIDSQSAAIDFASKAFDATPAGLVDTQRTLIKWGLVTAAAVAVATLAPAAIRELK